MGNNPNSKEDIKLSHNDINTLKVTWNEIASAGLSDLGVGLMTRYISLFLFDFKRI